MPLTKKLGHACGIACGLPSTSFLKASQQLAGELGIVGVLSESVLRVGPLTGSASA
jgi:hypothetical protein